MTTGSGIAWYVVAEGQELAVQNDGARELLAISESKVSDSGIRAELSAEIEAVDNLLAEPVFNRIGTGLTGGTVEAQASLAAASDMVRASMAEFRRSEIATALESLASVNARGEDMYTATEGGGTDEAVRARLRAALDATDAARESADGDLGALDLGQLNQISHELSTKRSIIVAATKDLSDAQDAITCPAPDQVWLPESGHVPQSELSPIPWSPSDSIRSDVLDSFIALDAEFYQAFGEHLTINSAYRTYAEQKSLYDPSSPIAAAPGCSNHGLGLAVDIGGGVETFGTAPYSWLKTHAKDHGWIHPPFAEPDGRVPEPWHWQSELAPVSS